MNTFPIIADVIFDRLGRGGFYIESGAHNGISGSNTLRLEQEKGWVGMLVEPTPSSFTLCRQMRGPNNILVNKAISSPEHEGTMIWGDWDDSPMSSVGGHLLGRGNRSQVPCTTITRLLEEHHIPQIDFWSLDVEGVELTVLQGLDFNRWRPKMICIEVWEPEKAGVFAFMKAKGYSEPENISNFSKENNPMWNELHNDYLFI